MKIFYFLSIFLLVSSCDTSKTTKKEFKIEKITEGLFMADDYHEQFIIKAGNCVLKSPKSNDQAQYGLMSIQKIKEIGILIIKLTSSLCI